jgi:REP element-mobilizing transposase RayT
MTPHRARPLHRAGEPVHVTLRARIAPLRSQFLFPTLRLALVRAARRDPERFRIVHFSIQKDHIHLLVEAEDKRALSSGIRGLMIRVARYANDLLGRRGAFWADRWHGRALTSPRTVRNGLVYVLANFRKHEHGGTPSQYGNGGRMQRAGLDPYSSAAWFDGWRDRSPPSAPRAEDARCFVGRTWLLRVGWRKHGLLELTEAPVTAETTRPVRATLPRRSPDPV